MTDRPRVLAARLAPALVALVPWAAAAAQVGHDPAGSPYRDLRYGQFLTATAGWMSGGGGQLGIGPHRGWVATLRHDFLADRTLTIGIGGGYARLERNYADLASTADPPLLGPVEHRVLFGEGVLQLNITGGKTWRNLAPYFSAGIGLAFAAKVADDTSGYNFGTKFYFAPGIGTRVFVSRRLFLRLEGRAQFWNLSYPATYRNDPDGFGPRVGPLAGRSLKEWSPVPMLHAGLGFAFHRPFF
jgi:hypothetical protein